MSLQPPRHLRERDPAAADPSSAEGNSNRWQWSTIIVLIGLLGAIVLAVWPVRYTVDSQRGLCGAAVVAVFDSPQFTADGNADGVQSKCRRAAALYLVPAGAIAVACGAVVLVVATTEGRTRDENTEPGSDGGPPAAAGPDGPDGPDGPNQPDSRV